MCFAETENDIGNETDFSTDLETVDDIETTHDIDTDQLSATNTRIAVEQRSDSGWKTLIDVLDGDKTRNLQRN